MDSDEVLSVRSRVFSTGSAAGIPNQLMTVQDLASFLKVPVSWVYERVRRSEIPTVPHLGRYKRFDPEVIRQLFSSPSHGSLKIETRKRGS